ncbi:MAG TPA: tetratricopeptide repeat protein [Longimicrobiales bacterium]|nr:tetratricopeptide repeat protein [Longimicrobiales bacterium]
MFRLKLFGSASIEGPEGPLTGRPVQRRRIGLLALLAVARRRGMTRDKLIGFLWPDADPDRARRLLSDSMYRISKAIGVEAFTAAGEELRLQPERLPSDVWEFEDALERGDWRLAADLHDAPFLDGFFLTDADELERWVDGQRERLARELARALEALADEAERENDVDGAGRWWHALSARDPYSSRIALRLMRALESSGDRVGALRHGQAHARVLREELDVEPDAELTAYLALLRAPGSGTAATIRRDDDASPRAVASASGTAPAPDPAADAADRRRRSIAVLPFENLGPDPDQEYFADGVTEDVIAQLAKLAGLRVIARASVMPFKGHRRGLREIGAELGADTMLTGSVRRATDRVRIVAQLVDAATEECLWSETYDRRMLDIFAIQTDVALHIADALRARLSPDERSRLGKRPTGDMEAYQLYLRGRYCHARHVDVHLRQSARYFERAIERDPGYALAHASLGLAYSQLAEDGVVDASGAYGRARSAADRALQIDPELSEAHCLLGHMKFTSEFDWSGAERAFRRAIELSPSNADAYDLYGRMCTAMERYDEAIALLARAQELDPLAHRSDLAAAYIRAERYDEAVNAAENAVEFDPAYPRSRATLGWAYLKSGRPGEGIEQLQRAVSLTADTPAWQAQLGQAYAVIGDERRAREILAALRERARDGYVSPYHLAYLHTGLGEHDEALDLLERAYEERAAAVASIKGSFLFAPLRPHPRFQSLLRRMNLI